MTFAFGSILYRGTPLERGLLFADTRFTFVGAVPPADDGLKTGSVARGVAVAFATRDVACMEDNLGGLERRLRGRRLDQRSLYRAIRKQFRSWPRSVDSRLLILTRFDGQGFRLAHFDVAGGMKGVEPRGRFIFAGIEALAPHVEAEIDALHANVRRGTLEEITYASALKSVVDRAPVLEPQVGDLVGGAIQIVTLHEDGALAEPGWGARVSRDGGDTWIREIAERKDLRQGRGRAHRPAVTSAAISAIDF